MKISNLCRSAMCDAMVDKLDEGSGASYIEIRTGSAPTNTTDSDSGTLLATLTASDPAFGAASNGVATAAAISPDTNIDNTGTAAHWRWKDSDGEVHAQGTVGTSGADLIVTTTAFVAGGTISITSWTMTMPAT